MYINPKFIDPDTEDVPWFDKREALCEAAYEAGQSSVKFAENAALKAGNEEIMQAALETSAAKGERIRELEAQVARLTEPVSDEEWAEFQQISRSEGGVMQRFRINDLLAARKETP